MGKRKLIYGVGINDADYKVKIGDNPADWRVEIALLARADQLDNDRLRGVETIKL